MYKHLTWCESSVWMRCIWHREETEVVCKGPSVLPPIMHFGRMAHLLQDQPTHCSAIRLSTSVTNTSSTLHIHTQTVILYANTYPTQPVFAFSPDCMLIYIISTLFDSLYMFTDFTPWYTYCTGEWWPEKNWDLVPERVTYEVTWATNSSHDSSSPIVPGMVYCLIVLHIHRSMLICTCVNLSFFVWLYSVSSFVSMYMHNQCHCYMYKITS